MKFGKHNSIYMYTRRLLKSHNRISRIQQEHDEKEKTLIYKHGEQLKYANLQAENELREKTMSMRKEHDAQLRALRDQHKDECRQLQEELDVQRTKEERQRALLQLQWKVMSDHPEEDQEVESKKASFIVGTCNIERSLSLAAYTLISIRFCSTTNFKALSDCC